MFYVLFLMWYLLPVSYRRRYISSFFYENLEEFIEWRPGSLLPEVLFLNSLSIINGILRFVGGNE